MNQVVLSALSLAAISFFAVAPAVADSIPYPNVGTIAPAPGLTVANTGEIDLYYAGSTASFTDYISLCDTTESSCTGEIFDNHATALGTEAILGGVHAGDNLEVFVYSPDGIFSSVPGDSADGVNHVFATPYSNSGSPNLGGGIPAGTFIGVEDEPNGISDFNYNDDNFVFTNISGGADVAPEPASFMLIGLGLAGLGVKRFRSKRSV